MILVAIAAAAARFSTPSLMNICSRCLFTVRALMFMISLASRFDLPWAIQNSTSLSRDQNPGARPSIAGDPRARRHCRRRWRCVREQHPHLEAAARARLTFDQQFGPHDLGQQPSNREPEADDRRRAGVADPLERLEDALKVGLGDAYTAVGNLELGYRIAPAYGQRRRPRRCIFYRIGDDGPNRTP